eukprot:1993906-Pyramimonas_sp.AAC.1
MPRRELKRLLGVFRPHPKKPSTNRLMTAASSIAVIIAICVVTRATTVREMAKTVVINNVGFIWSKKRRKFLFGHSTVEQL